MNSKNPSLPGEGDVLADKYVVERVLGAGGMGVVVAARHQTLGQRVALKFLAEEALKSEEARARFVREAKAAVGLKSEHVARVIDVGTLESGAPYIVMEHLEGSDLRQIVSEHGPLPIASAVDYVLQAADAVAEAHGEGIIHRDLKPANLFLTRRKDGSPWVKVLDFGISKAVTPEGEGGITRTDAVLGSPSYMAPEQIRSAKDVDPRTDIWSFGVVLYELIAAAPPFDGDNIATLSAQICMDEPKPISHFRDDVPPELAAVVHKCLEKDPAKRYQDLGELSRALLPFAPEGAKTIVERIGRLARPMAFDDTLPVGAARGKLPSGATAETATGTAATVASEEGSNRWLMLAVVALTLVVGGAFATLVMRPSGAEPAPAASAAPETAAPAVAASPPAPEPEPPPVVEPEPPPPSPSASVAKPRVTAAPKSIEKCKPGQILSKGHCCAIGLVWNGNKCDRPLATKVPF